MTNIECDNALLQDSLLNPKVYDVIVIGGGVAGLTAGLYAARDGFKTLVLEGTMMSNTDYPGGALNLTPEIANYPGFPAASGQELIEIMRAQAIEVGANIVEERAENLTISEKQGCCHKIVTDEENEYKGRVIIVATGATAKQLGVPGEIENIGRGVSTCATCDGFFYKNKVVAVAGGGDTAVEDALVLTKYAEKVFLLVRGDKLRTNSPEARMIAEHPDIEIMFNTSIQEINSENNSVISATINRNGETEELALNGVFVAIGSLPATQFLENTNVALDKDGYILTIPDSTKVQGVETNGIFAAGDAADKIYRQAITSAGKAAQAVIEARHYLTASTGV